MSIASVIRGGFRTPSPSTRMCKRLVVHDGTRLVRPRPCKRPSIDGSFYCGLHARIVARTPALEVRDGGFCVWCGGPARSYKCELVTISLCTFHGRALARAIREGR